MRSSNALWDAFEDMDKQKARDAADVDKFYKSVVKTTAIHPPRARRPGPPPGQDYDTLTKLHGRPRGVFEEDRVATYKPTAG